MGLVPYLMVTCHRGWVLIMISNLSALVMISNLSDLFFHLALSLKVSIRLTFVHMVILLTVAVVHLSRENTDHSKLLFQMKGTQHLQTLGTISSVILHIVHFGFFFFFYTGIAVVMITIELIFSVWKQIPFLWAFAVKYS